MLADHTAQIIVCLLTAIVCFLPVTVVMLWNRRRLALRDADNDESVYFIRYSTFGMIVSAVCTIGCYGMAVLAFIMTDGEWVAFAVFLAGAMLGVFGWLGYVLWEIRVDAETLTFYRFPLSPRQVRFSEITSVRILNKQVMGHLEGRIHLIGYAGSKKLFDIDGDMSNSQRLFSRFADEKHLEWAVQGENGKVEVAEVRESFDVTETLANRLRAVFGFIFFAGLAGCLLIFQEQLRQEEPDNYLFFLVAYLIILAMSTEELLKTMVRKITVNYRTIQVRSALGKTFSFSFDDIEYLEDKDNHILLYVRGRKPLKVRKTYKNYVLLEERLQRGVLRGTP